MARRIRDRVLGPDDDGWIRGLDEAQVPDRYREASIDAIKVPKLRKWLQRATTDVDWMAQGCGYFIHGQLNSGKSSIAAILLMEAVRRCERTLWLSVRDVPLARFREGTRGQMLDDRLVRCDFLVLDDLGSERFKLEGPAGAALEETIRIMYDRHRPVVITSNIQWRLFPANYVGSEPLVSVVKRVTFPVEIENDQWPAEPQERR